jgi:predicted protein tyrosine phosphatase
MRSSTAEAIYAAEGYSVKSAGTSKNATVTLSNDLIEWADIIFAMEEKHKVILTNHFFDSATDKKIVVLDIPDNYYFMEAGLVKLIKDRVKPYLD